MVQSAIEGKDFRVYIYSIQKMASWEPDEIDFQGDYDKVDPIDDANLDESINELNRSILEQEKLENRIVGLNGHQ